MAFGQTTRKLVAYATGTLAQLGQIEAALIELAQKHPEFRVEEFRDYRPQQPRTKGKGTTETGKGT